MNNKQKTQKILPKLRFSEFSGDWEYKKIFNIAILKKGRGLSKNKLTKGGEYKCILYGELFTVYDERINSVKSRTNFNEGLLSVSGDILIPASTTTSAIDLAKAVLINEDGVLLGGDINIIRPIDKNFVNSMFLTYVLIHVKKYDIAKLAQGITIIHLYGSSLSRLFVSMPKLPEQTKIADCLTSLDDLIKAQTDKLEALQEHKKGLMQKIFSKEIRFPEFSKDWEEKRLGDILNYEQPIKYIVKNTSYNNKNNIPVLTAGKTFILGYTNESHGIFKKNLPVIIFDDFTTVTQFVDFPFKVKSSAMKILKAKNSEIIIKLVYELIQTVKFIANGHKRYWISEYQELKIKLPHLNEQTKIADCLTSLDDLIKAQTDTLEALQEHKKGLMQGLFPS